MEKPEIAVRLQRDFLKQVVDIQFPSQAPPHLSLSQPAKAKPIDVEQPTQGGLGACLGQPKERFGPE